MSYNLYFAAVLAWFYWYSCVFVISIPDIVDDTIYVCSVTHTEEKQKGKGLCSSIHYTMCHFGYCNFFRDDNGCADCFASLVFSHPGFQYF